MSDDIKSAEGSAAESQADPIVNLKAEMSRKLGNTESKISELQKTNELLLSKLSQLTQPAAAPAAKSADLSTLLYSDPDAYAAEIERRAEERAMRRVNEQQAQAVRTNSVLAELQNEFPELSDSGNELTKKAVEMYNNLPPDEKNSSLAYKVAVKAAALELGVKPRSKRPVDDEPMGSSYGQRSGSRRAATKLAPETEELAAIFGLDTSKQEVKDRLLKNSQRNWTKYKPIK